MLGDRDSELAVVVWPPKLGHGIESTMAGQTFEASAFVRDLRLSLWCEHLGR